MDILGISGTYTGVTFHRLSSDIPIEGFPEYNPDKCQEYLAAGFPKGKGLPELEHWLAGFYPKTKEYGEYITALLNEQGIL